MKWVFLLALAVYTPLLAGWLRATPRHAPKVWALLGFLPFVLGPWNLYVAPISWATWAGFVKGAEVSLLDGMAIAVLFAAPRQRRLPLKWPFILYIGAVILSAAFANLPTAALFYAWQLARVFLLFAAVAAACQDDRAPAAILMGMVLGLGYQAANAAYALLSGALQTGGTLGHQNLLGLMSHFVVLPALGLLLAGQRGWVAPTGVMAGIAVAILTASRATIGLVGAGLVGLFILSAIRRPTGRKMMLGVAGVAVLGVAGALAMTSLERRFSAAPLDSAYDERAAFENAAGMMIDDHPTGVGANHFVLIANVGGYYSRAGVVWTSGVATVHNVYLLAVAETGYLGLLAFLAMLLSPMIVAFRAAWKFSRDRRGDLLLGLGFSLLIVAIHSFFEWIFVSFQTQYMFAIASGLIVGVARQLGYWNTGKTRASRRLLAPVQGEDGVPAGVGRPVPAATMAPERAAL